MTNKGGRDWGLWKRQAIGVLRLEIGKNFLSKRALPLYFLIGLPLFVFGARAIAPLSERELGSVGDAGVAFATIFQLMMIRGVVFFGCVFIFTSLFRGEMLERSLHYLFLSPVRREVLVAGKYISGLVSVCIIFGTGVVLSHILMYLPHGRQGLEFFTDGPGVGHMLAYVGVTWMACMGYGAIFLFMGLYFKNPILPAMAVFGWEWLNSFLPATLKKISIVHYLISLSPVPLPSGVMAFLAEPASAWFSIPGLLIVTLLVLVLASFRIRTMEISYGGE